ncbi:hypothetical protein KKF84_06150 [Myxococcota bacterium]|nr:hypothetical protein [Myxococcota bacterium]
MDHETATTHLGCSRRPTFMELRTCYFAHRRIFDENRHVEGLRALFEGIREAALFITRSYLDRRHLGRPAGWELDDPVTLADVERFAEFVRLDGLRWRQGELADQTWGIRSLYAPDSGPRAILDVCLHCTPTAQELAAGSMVVEYFRLVTDLEALKDDRVFKDGYRICPHNGSYVLSPKAMDKLMKAVDAGTPPLPREPTLQPLRLTREVVVIALPTTPGEHTVILDDRGHHGSTTVFGRLVLNLRIREAFEVPVVLAWPSPHRQDNTPTARTA